MIATSKMSVTDLKNKLLEVVRRVEKGDVIEITKDGKSVAILSPSASHTAKTLGFAKLTLAAGREPDISGGWTFDVDNLAPKKARRRAK